MGGGADEPPWTLDRVSVPEMVLDWLRRNGYGWMAPGLGSAGPSGPPQELGDAASLAWQELMQVLARRFPAAGMLDAVQMPVFQGLETLKNFWTFWEVWGFLSSGGEENRGDMVALTAELAGWLAKRGAASESALVFGGSWLLRGACGAVAIGWTMWEFFKLGSYLHELVFGDPDAEEVARRRAWQSFMFKNFWGDYLDLTSQASGEAFDRLAGGGASHGVTPAIDGRAELDLLRDISDRFLERMDVMQVLARLERDKQVAYDPTDPGQKAMRPGDTIAGLQQAMVADLGRVIDFEMDPSHWKLTPEQVSLLPEPWQERFEAKAELEARVAGGDVSAQDELARLKQEMSDEARALYEFGPASIPDPSPVHGPPSPQNQEV
jgi:hypothetical protein